ncbi:hypothetical protein [Methanococcus maripaludis]|uniref:Uncharacterized protein n=1 Tax=Methanococcus maripaludis TaxID=39152 RepID=A0A7J9S2F9_METMI|nr:hypothetical protein [Methanococcus maripaludis]MBB6067880.1 hypothetical protein [Methanococcus maripaludis]
MYLKTLVNQSLKNGIFDKKEFKRLCKDMGIQPQFTEKVVNGQIKKKFNFQAVFEEMVEKLKNMDIIERCKLLKGLDTFSPRQELHLRNMKENFMSNFLIGKGGGKDFMASQLFDDELMDTTFEDLPFPRVDFVNIAPNAHLAYNVFFREFKSWFRKNRLWKIIGVDDVEIKANSKAPIKLNKTSLNIGESILFSSGTSNSASFEGSNLRCVVVDEISDENFRNAEQMFYQAKSSVQTRFGNKNGKVVSISWTRFPTPYPKDDVGYKIFIENKGLPGVYSVMEKTWEVNTRVTREDFEDDYQRDRILAKKMYECEPPALDAYYINLEALESRRKLNVGLFSWRPIYSTIKEDGMLKLKLEFKQLQTCDHTIYCHTDLSKNHDMCVITLSHFERGKVVVTDIISLDPSAKDDSFRVDYQSLELFYEHLKRNYSVKFSYDQYQSEYFIQKFGGTLIQKHLDLWTNFKELVEGDKQIHTLEGPKRKGRLEIYCTNDDIWKSSTLQIIQHQIDGDKIRYFGERSNDYAISIVSSAFACRKDNAYRLDEEDIFSNVKYPEDEWENEHGETFEFSPLM